MMTGARRGDSNRRPSNYESVPNLPVGPIGRPGAGQRHPLRLRGVLVQRDGDWERVERGLPGRRERIRSVLEGSTKAQSRRMPSAMRDTWRTTGGPARSPPLLVLNGAGGLGDTWSGLVSSP